MATPQVGGDLTYSVLLANGMQTVSPVVAQILQNANGTGADPSNGPARDILTYYAIDDPANIDFNAL